MGEYLNNVLIGTAQIADSAVTPAKLSFTAPQIVKEVTTSTTYNSSTEGDVSGWTHTFAAGTLQVGDVIEVMLIGKGAADTGNWYAYCRAKNTNNPCTGLTAQNVVGIFHWRFHISSVTTAEASGWQAYNANPVSATATTISIDNITTNDLIVKIRAKVTTDTKVLTLYSAVWTLYHK